MSILVPSGGPSGTDTQFCAGGNNLANTALGPWAGPTSLVGSSVTVTVGTGGAASTAASFNAGSSGGNSRFGGIVTGHGGTGATNFNGEAATWTYSANASTAGLNLSNNDFNGRAGGVLALLAAP